VAFEMQVKFKKYDQLKQLAAMKESPHQRNKHTPEQIERLAKIMKECGVRQPIHISTLSDTICFGHGRKLAAELNGWTEYPVVYQEFDNDTEEYLCVQNDNAIADWAELDLAAINADLPDLGPCDLELLGIKDFQMDPPIIGGDDKPEELDKPKCPECGQTIK